MRGRGQFTPLSREARRHILNIAHRGASAYAPENSLDAFRKAAAMGADMVEVDIRVTADGRPVVAHDENLKRVYGSDAAISEMKLRDLRAVTATNAEPVPTFEEVAAVCADLKLGLYLDLKSFSLSAITSVLSSLEGFRLVDYSIFGSFRPDWVAEIKAWKPELHTSVLFSSMHVDPVLLARAVNADYVHPCWENAAPEPHRLLTPDWLHSIREAGLGIVCWHEERESEILALAALGVDAICSDKPDLLHDLTRPR